MQQEKEKLDRELEDLKPSRLLHETDTRGKKWSPEGWTQIVFLRRQEPVTPSVNMST